MGYAGHHLVAIGVAAVAGAGVSGFRTRSLVRRLNAAERAATTDPLTGLANRVGLRREFEGLVAQSDPYEHVGLVLLDLNDFKMINDTYGHEVGDRLLVTVGSRLARLSVRGRVVCASRLGGDEFVIVFAYGRDSASAELMTSAAAAAGGAVGLPLEVGPVRIEPRASMGTAYAPAVRASLREMLAEADAAMYRAKRGASEAHSRIVPLDGRQVPQLRLTLRARDRHVWVESP